MNTLTVGDYVKLTESNSGVYVVEEVSITGVVEIQLLRTHYNDIVQDGMLIVHRDNLIRLNKYGIGDRVVETKRFRAHMSMEKKTYIVDNVSRVPPRGFLYCLRRTGEGPKIRSEKELMIKRAKPARITTPMFDDGWTMQYPPDVEATWDDV